MTFSEFAKMLIPYCKEEAKNGDYVVKLVDMIMGGRPGRAHGDGSYQNPLRNKDERTLQSYLNGERNISQQDASRIFSSIDKYKFEEYIRRHCSEDAQKALLKEIFEKEKNKNAEDAAEACADLFETILRDLALPKEK